MVLEISATPSIFTFKLWDWGRLGLDGLPRPINIGHGSKVIQWERQTEFTRDNLVNQVTPIASGEGWREERTGLHENEFIETRRHWFTAPVTHHTDGGVQVFNLIEGDEVIIESPTGAFEPDDPIPDRNAAQEPDRKHRPKFVDYFIKKNSDNK